MLENSLIAYQSVSVSELESSPGYLGGGLELLDSVKFVTGGGAGGAGGNGGRMGERISTEKRGTDGDKRTTSGGKRTTVEEMG